MVNQEIFLLTPKMQLTARFELAEMQNLRVAAEVREGNPERTLSQEVHMFTQARALIEDMRNAFTIEDQGCIQRTEMLSTKWVCEQHLHGNHAEKVLQEKHAEYSEKINRLKQQAKAYVGSQNEDILSSLKQELSRANQEAVVPSTDWGRESETAFRDEYLSNELLMAN